MYRAPEVAVKRSLPLLLSLSALAGAGWWWSHADPQQAPPPDDPKLFANRVWAERAPRNERDLVLYFVPIQLGSKRPGIVQRVSKYAWGGETFQWSRDGASLVLELPQQQRTAKLKARTWKCDDAPQGFDLCLELSAGDQKQRLYSRKGWRVPKGEEALPEGLWSLDHPEALPEVGGCTDCTEVGLDVLR